MNHELRITEDLGPGRIVARCTCGQFQPHDDTWGGIVYQWQKHHQEGSRIARLPALADELEEEVSILAWDKQRVRTLGAEAARLLRWAYDRLATKEQRALKLNEVGWRMADTWPTPYTGDGLIKIRDAWRAPVQLDDLVLPDTTLDNVTAGEPFDDTYPPITVRHSPIGYAPGHGMEQYECVCGETFQSTDPDYAASLCGWHVSTKHAESGGLVTIPWDQSHDEVVLRDGTIPNPRATDVSTETAP